MNEKKRKYCKYLGKAQFHWSLPYEFVCCKEKDKYPRISLEYCDKCKDFVESE